MLQLLDESLESFLRAEVPLGARDVDVAFDAPDKEWASQISRPTVNLFLWDIYHDQKILADGVIPRELVLGNKNYRPEMEGVDVPQGTYVHINGTDLVRGDDGRHLGGQPNPLGERPFRCGVRDIRLERGQRRHRRAQHVHGVCVLRRTNDVDDPTGQLPAGFEQAVEFPKLRLVR